MCVLLARLSLHLNNLCTGCKQVCDTDRWGRSVVLWKQNTQLHCLVFAVYTLVYPLTPTWANVHCAEHGMLTEWLQLPRYLLWSQTKSRDPEQSQVVERRGSPDRYYIYHFVQTDSTPVVWWSKQKTRLCMESTVQSEVKRRTSSLTSATPKSVILTVSLVVRRRFPGLMSLCMTPRLCRYSSPSINCTKYLDRQTDTHSYTHTNECMLIVYIL